MLIGFTTPLICVRQPRRGGYGSNWSIMAPTPDVSGELTESEKDAGLASQIQGQMSEGFWVDLINPAKKN